MADDQDKKVTKELTPQVATLYRAAVSFGTTEVQVIWTRYAGFLVLNGFFVNALLGKWDRGQEPPFILLGALALLGNAIWHMLNFSGWLNQCRWYRIAANVDESLGGYRLPTGDFKDKVVLPCGWIYELAQVIPTGFSIGAAICIALGISGPSLSFTHACYVVGGIWLAVAILTVVIERKAISAWKGAQVV